MAVSESDRHELHDKLIETIGERAAESLMSYLPPVGWADVATKRDLDALATKLDVTELRTEMAELRTELKVDMGELRTEIAAVGSRLFWQMLTLQFTAAGLFIAVARLA